MKLSRINLQSGQMQGFGLGGAMSTHPSNHPLLPTNPLDFPWLPGLPNVTSPVPSPRQRPLVWKRSSMNFPKREELLLRTVQALDRWGWGTGPGALSVQ